jgi:type I restriction enzyme S subunit
MSQKLEAMARALFKSWFVDFDPVRAKAERRDPGLPKPLADLFPDSFEDSELGEIPEGWEVGTLGDVLQQRVERCVPSAETAGRPYVPIECISPRSLLLADSRSGEEAQSSLTRFYAGDLLFGAMRPYFHKVCIAPFDGTTRTTAFVLHPRHDADFAFATLLFHRTETIEFATRHSTGSTIPYAVWTDSMEAMPALLPPPKVRRAFDKAVRPMLARISSPYFESRTLAALRDALLPKLISGELRIHDAESSFEIPSP